MKNLFFIFIFVILTSCESNDDYSPKIYDSSLIDYDSSLIDYKFVISTTFLNLFPNDKIEVTSDDLSNKGLICNMTSDDFSNHPKSINFGFWFVDNKRFEKWIIMDTDDEIGGFEFVQIEKDTYTHYEVTEDTIILKYSQDENSPPYSIDNSIDRKSLNWSFVDELGICIVLVGRERFLGVLEQISDVYGDSDLRLLFRRMSNRWLGHARPWEH